MRREMSVAIHHLFLYYPCSISQYRVTWRGTRTCYVLPGLLPARSSARPPRLWSSTFFSPVNAPSCLRGSSLRSTRRRESATQSMRGAATSSRRAVASVAPFSLVEPTAQLQSMRPVAMRCSEVLGDSVTKSSDRALLAGDVALARPHWGAETLERERMERACTRGERLKCTAECPKMRPHQVLPAEIVVVLTISADLTTCGVTCASPSVVQVRLRANSSGAIGCTTLKLAV